MVSTACKLVLTQVSLNLNLFPHHQRGDSRKGGKENLPSLFSLAIGHFVVVVLISTRGRMPVRDDMLENEILNLEWVLSRSLR